MAHIKPFTSHVLSSCVQLDRTYLGCSIIMKGSHGTQRLLKNTGQNHVQVPIKFHYVLQKTRKGGLFSGDYVMRYTIPS